MWKLGCALGKQAGKCQQGKQECPALGKQRGRRRTLCVLPLCWQPGTDTQHCSDPPWQQPRSCQTRKPLCQRTFRAAVCGLEILGTTEKKKKKDIFFFFFRVYLAFDKQNDFHSKMCILLNKYLCKYHRHRSVISLHWFKNKPVHLIVYSFFF